MAAKLRVLLLQYEFNVVQYWFVKMIVNTHITHKCMNT